MENDKTIIFLISITILAFIFTLLIMTFLEFTFYQKERVVSCVNSEECIKYIKNTKKIPTKELLEYFNEKGNK